MMSRGSFVAAAALLSLGAAACGPSYQTLYEGDSHFERCYAMDERGDVALEAKSGCWKGYVARHSYGQTRDRIRYAGIRMNALARLPALPTDEAMMEAAPGGTIAAVNAPSPTNAFAPPPKTLHDSDAGVAPTVEVASAKAPEGPVAPTPAAAPPQSDCADTCSRAWSTCRSTCESGRPSDPARGALGAPGAGSVGPASPDARGARCDACAKTYRGCMRACYR
jgi:hypothetical protein